MARILAWLSQAVAVPCIRFHRRLCIQVQNVRAPLSGFVSLLTHHIKHRLDAVLGFMRCIAPGCRQEGIRVNALCPGIVRTNIISEEAWDTYFRAEDFCPMELIVKVTLLLFDGEEVVDTNNKRIDASKMYGQTLETSGPNYYLREQPAWCDDIAKSVMTKMSW